MPAAEARPNRPRAHPDGDAPVGDRALLPEGDATEVERLSRAFAAELGAPGEAGRLLTRRMASMAVRMDRSVDIEQAAQAENVRKALEEFRAPEGADEATVIRLRSLTARLAMFDPSPAAERARKYEAAAERSFFRALKELRLLQKDAARPAQPAAPAPAPAPTAKLGSISPEKPISTSAPARPVPIPRPIHSKIGRAALEELPEPSDVFELPFAIGRAP